MVESHGYVFSVDVVVEKQLSQMWLRDKKVPSKILNSSFVIERLTGRKENECFDDEIPGFSPWVCNGDIVLKELTKSE